MSLFFLFLYEDRLKKAGSQVPRAGKSIDAAVAAEWQWQGERRVYTYTMPLTGLAIAAADMTPEARERTVNKLVEYFQSDTLCCRSGEGREGELERQLWAPLVEWAGRELGAQPAVSHSIVKNEHPPAATRGAQAALQALSNHSLAGVEAISASAKSLILALAVSKERIGPQDAVRSALLEEHLQQEEWGTISGGHDVDTAQLRARVFAASCFLRLARSDCTLPR